MNPILSGRSPVIVLAGALFLVTSPAHGTILADLQTDWSNTNNPNPGAFGTWAYTQGGSPLPFISVWVGAPADSLSGWGPAANAPGNFLPFFFRTVNPFGDTLPGDVLVHSTDQANGGPDGPAAHRDGRRRCRGRLRADLAGRRLDHRPGHRRHRRLPGLNTPASDGASVNNSFGNLAFRQGATFTGLLQDAPGSCAKLRSPANRPAPWSEGAAPVWGIFPAHPGSRTRAGRPRDWSPSRVWRRRGWPHSPPWRR